MTTPSETPEQTTKPAPTVWPGLRYDDAPAALRFLVGVCGFTETLVVPGEDRDVVHAELRWPEGGGVMLGSTNHREGVHDRMKPGASSVYVVTADPDAVYQRVKAAGAPLLQDLHDTDYGSHTFTTTDPEGNMWTFGTYPGA
ncbi:MAG: VOC family protein [Sciscionella sp.]